MIGAMLPAKLKRNKKQVQHRSQEVQINNNYCHHYTTVHYEYFDTITYNFQVQVFVTAVELKHVLFRFPL